MIRSVTEVPRLVASLAKSFRNDRGERVNIEFYWMYTGTNSRTLDQARFARTIGFHSSKRDILDKIIDPTATTFPSIAVHPKTQGIGLHLISVPQEISGAGFMDERSTFIPHIGHLILDRPLAANLNLELQQHLMQQTGKTIEQISNNDLLSFVLNHSQSKEFHYCSGTEKIVSIPASMTVINAIGTQHTHYPLRPLMEQMRENKFSNGELIADGHIHEALTAKRISKDPWLQKLADRYGAVKAAATLSLFDVQGLLQMEDFSKIFVDIPEDTLGTQYAAREIFVIDDFGEVKAHSILNFAEIMKDEKSFIKFLTVAKTSLASPADQDYRLEFHDMIQEFTVQKNVDEPLVPSDYS